MESTEVYIGPEPHIEVHKYYGGVVTAAVVLSLVVAGLFFVMNILAGGVAPCCY